MALDEAQVGILTAERLKIPLENRLRLQTYIPNALHNLAQSVANDPLRRRLLLTDQSACTATVTTSTYNTFADLTTVQDTYGVMLEYLQYGNVYYIAATNTWPDANVDDNTDTIVIPNHGYVTGQAVRLTTAGTLPSPLVTGQTYYIIAVDAVTVQLATTYDNALNAVPQTLTSVGTGTSTMTAYQKDVCQWLASPSQGYTDPAIPFDYIYIWLEAGLLYTNRTNGTFAFSVPYIPTLNGVSTTLPSQLEDDLIDEMAKIAITSGFPPHQA